MNWQDKILEQIVESKEKKKTKVSSIEQEITSSITRLRSLGGLTEPGVTPARTPEIADLKAHIVKLTDKSAGAMRATGKS